MKAPIGKLALYCCLLALASSSCGQSSVPAKKTSEAPADMAAAAADMRPGVEADVAPDRGSGRIGEMGDLARDGDAEMGVADSDPDYPARPPETLGADRPARLIVPGDYDPRRAYPLIVMLHGYGSSAAQHDIYFGLSDRVDRFDFALLLVDGTRDTLANRFWNAGPACCDLQSSGVDDLGYVADLIEDATRAVHLDGRVGVIGHSNGGFMAHTLACQRADLVTAIATLAASEAVDAPCEPSAPVAVLQIHGTGDTVIGYDGGIVLGATTRYISASELAESWSHRLGCAPESRDGPARDLDAFYLGSESSSEVWSGCRGEADVQLWTIPLGAHTPALSGSFSDQVIEHLLAISR